VQWQVSTDGGATWTNDGTDAGAGTETLTVLAAAASQDGYEYRALYTNAAGSTPTQPAKLTVQTAPTVSEDPASTGVVVGEAAHFTAAAEGKPPPTVQWQISTDFGASWSDDLLDPGSETGKLTVLSTLVENGYEYRARFTNVAGSVASAPATLTVSEAKVAPTVTENPHESAVTEGEPAVFTAAAEGTPTPHVKWQLSTDGGTSWGDDTADAGHDSSTLVVSATTLSESGYEYRAVFANTAGTATSEAATLTVNKKPLAPTVTANPHAATVTEGHPASFTAEASGFPAPTVAWQRSSDGGATWVGTGASGDTLTIPSTTASETGDQFRAVFSNSAGTATSAPATLTVDTPPKAIVQPTDVSVVVGEAAVFKAAASGSPAPQVQWERSTDGGASWSSDKADVSGGGTLTVLAATLSENGYQYRAHFANSAGTAVSNIATLTVSEAKVAPTVTENPHASAVTQGETAVFTAAAEGTPTPHVKWQVSTNGGATWGDDTVDAGHDTGTLVVSATTLAESGYEYRAVFANTAGTAASGEATLTVGRKAVAPTVTASPHDTAVTEGHAASFTAEAAGFPAPTVAWQRSSDGGATWVATGVVTDTLTIASTTSDESGEQFRAVFSNSAGTATSVPATLIVQTAPVVTVQPIGVAVSEGEAATFTAASSGNPAPAVRWQLSTDGGASWAEAGATSNTLTVAAVTPAQSGYQYRAVFTNVAGETTSAAATLSVSSPAPPTASFSWFPPAPRVGEAVSLVSTSTGPIAAFAWDVAGSSTFVPGGSVLSTTFTTTGNHLVSLRVSDAHGRTGVVTETIPVSAAKPKLLQPFPVVRIAGSDTALGARLTLLTVLAPPGARIAISCRGHGCPARPETRLVSAAGPAAGAALVRFHRFERALRAGVVLQIRVTRGVEIGKYTRFAIRRGKLPVRVDSCLDPATGKPIPCPTA
jgi:hypothetical protein